MATFYSDHFEPTGGTSITTRDRTHIPMAGKSGGRMYVSVARVKALATTSDTIRMMTLPSNARILFMEISGDDASAAGAFDMGLHETEARGGTVLDQDLFVSAGAKNAARLDAFVESTTLTNQDRGKFLWELDDKGASTVTVDPQKQYDITITPSTSFTTTAIGLTLIVQYSLAG